MNEPRRVSSLHLCLLICELGAVTAERGGCGGPSVCEGPRWGRGRPGGWRYGHDEWVVGGVLGGGTKDGNDTI